MYRLPLLARYLSDFKVPRTGAAGDEGAFHGRADQRQPPLERSDFTRGVLAKPEKKAVGGYADGPKRRRPLAPTHPERKRMASFAQVVLVPSWEEPMFPTQSADPFASSSGTFGTIADLIAAGYWMTRSPSSRRLQILDHAG